MESMRTAYFSRVRRTREPGARYRVRSIREFREDRCSRSGCLRAHRPRRSSRWIFPRSIRVRQGLVRSANSSSCLGGSQCPNGSREARVVGELSASHEELCAYAREEIHGRVQECRVTRGVCVVLNFSAFEFHAVSEEHFSVSQAKPLPKLRLCLEIVRSDVDRSLFRELVDPCEKFRVFGEVFLFLGLFCSVCAPHVNRGVGLLESRDLSSHLRIGLEEAPIGRASVGPECLDIEASVRDEAHSLDRFEG